MRVITGLIRRLLWLVVLGLLGGAAAQWWRQRQAPDAPAAPEWPPIDSAPTTETPSTTEAPASTETPASPDAADMPEGGDEPSAPARVAPIAMSETVTSWVVPNEDGSCPIDHPIKANDNSGIFHVPEGRFYGRTKAERCYVDAEAATSDGYRQAKS